MDAQHQSIIWKLKPFYINHYLKVILSRIILTIGLRFKSPIIVAMAIILSLYRASSILATKKSKNKLIVLHKMGGFEDIEETFKLHHAKFDILLMRREYLKRICTKFFSSELGDLNYLSESTESEREEYRAFLTKVFNRILQVLNVKAILKFNIVYYSERELPAVCSSLGIKSLILQKEGLRPNISWQKMVDIYKCQLKPFLGHKVLTYNYDTKKCLISSGIVDSSDVEIIGMPRLDFSHKIREDRSPDPNCPVVVYYLIDKISGLCNYIDSNGKITSMRYEDNEGSIFYWDDLIERSNNAVIDYARANPDLQFIFKGKGKFENYKTDFSAKLPGNCKIATGATGHTLLKEASVIIGFNTTAIIEGIAAGVPVIVPLLFSSEPEEMKKYILDTKGAVSYAKTESELGNLIAEFSSKERASTLIQKEKSILDRALGNSDGKSSERLRMFLDTIMN
jgi:hypothetical protein